MDTREVPPTAEIFNIDQLVERHPKFFKKTRLQWAFRNRETNGLKDAIFKSRSGELYAHEPALLRWFLGLSGRSKPRASRHSSAREL